MPCNFHKDNLYVSMYTYVYSILKYTLNVHIHLWVACMQYVFKFLFFTLSKKVSTEYLLYLCNYNMMFVQHEHPRWLKSTTHSFFIPF